MKIASAGQQAVFELAPLAAMGLQDSRELLESQSNSCVDFEVLPQRDGFGIEVLGDLDLHSHFSNFGFVTSNYTVTRPFSEINPPNGYNNPTQLMNMARALEAEYPDLVQVIDVTSEWNGPSTVEGRSIYALKVSDNVQQDEEEPNQLIVSAHHCRELITPELAVDIAIRLAEGYSSGDTREIVDNFQTYIIWSQNPDGANHVWTSNNMWRKNRFRNSGGSVGVDLNRNYQMGWGYSCAGSATQSSCTYRGTGPASEAETQVMTLFQNERKFAKVIDFHSHAREVRVIYADNCRNCAFLPTSIDTYVKDVGLDFAGPMNYRQVRSCCTGGNIHTAYQERGSLAFLVETGTAFQPPADTMRAELVRVWPGAKWILEMPIALTGTATDSNGNPVDATFTTSGLDFSEGEVGGATNSRGVYHFWLPSGTWSVTATSGGNSQTASITTVYGEQVVRNWVF